MDTSRSAQLQLDGDDLLVIGEDVLTDRRARLFFRSVLGADQESTGYRCPRRRLTVAVIVLRVYDWLLNNHYDVQGLGEAGSTLSLELERRRSFFRTQEAAREQKSGKADFAFAPVEDALRRFGWSSERQLRPHQRAGVAHALTAINAGNFSVPGAGKTATTLATAVAHLDSGTIDLIAVIGPLACFDPWEQETRIAVGSRIRTRRVRGTAAQRQQIYMQTRPADLLLMSYSTAAADQISLLELFARHKVLMVVDESHRVKRFRGGVWAPALVELAKRARVRIILSGTPMPQSGRDLYSQLNILWPDGQLTGTRDAFATRVDDSFERIIDDVLPFVSRTPKSELGLPPYAIHRHEVELAGTQAEIYELIENRFRQKIADAATWRDKIESLRRGRPIRLLQAASNPLLFNSKDAYYHLPRIEDGNPTLMERVARYSEVDIPAKSYKALDLIRGIARGGGKVVCWSNFVANLDHFRKLVEREIGVPCFQIDGRVPAGLDGLHSDPYTDRERAGDADTREGVIFRFLNERGAAVLVTNPASCSESISLHSSCHNAIYLDRTFDCAMFLQSIDRIHRLGLPSDAHVEVHLINATTSGRSTIDALVDASLMAKSQRMQELLEGAEISPIHMSDDPAVDAEGTEADLASLLQYLLGELA